MIIKDINGELTICFDQDAWSRCDVQVEADGTIKSSGSGGATVHSWDEAFVDANGEYHFYYGINPVTNEIVIAGLPYYMNSFENKSCHGDSQNRESGYCTDWRKEHPCNKKRCTNGE